MTWMYHREGLSPDLRRVYDRIRRGVSSFNQIIEVEPMDSDMLFGVYQKVRYDDPYLFNVSGTASFDMKRDRAVAIRPEYTMDKARYAFLRERLQSMVDGMVAPLMDIPDPLQREEAVCRAIHKGIRWIKHEGGTGNLSEFLHDHTALGPLMYGSGTCEGLAFAFSALANTCGIDSGIVHNDTHAWNVVRLNGMLSHLDAGSADFTSAAFVINCFNLSDDEILETHEGAPRIGAVNNDLYTNSGRVAGGPESLSQVLRGHRSVLSACDSLSVRVWTEDLDDLVPVLKEFRRDSGLDIHVEIRGRILLVSTR